MTSSISNLLDDWRMANAAHVQLSIVIDVRQETSADVNDVLVVRRPPGYTLPGSPAPSSGHPGRPRTDRHALGPKDP